MEIPDTAADLEVVQRQLARFDPPPYDPERPPADTAGAFVCFGRGGGGSGGRGDLGWAAATVLRGGQIIDSATVSGPAGASYQPGFLALREAALLLTVVGRLREPFDLLFLNGTGRDHPRHAGIALHLGSQLRVPTVGTTNRTLVARGTWPQPLTRGARAPLAIGEEVVGYWLCTVSHARPLAVHAAWRTSAEVAANLALAATLLVRTPEPLRQARRLAREARSKDGG